MTYAKTLAVVLRALLDVNHNDAVFELSPLTHGGLITIRTEDDEMFYVETTRDDFIVPAEGDETDSEYVRRMMLAIAGESARKFPVSTNRRGLHLHVTGRSASWSVRGMDGVFTIERTGSYQQVCEDEERSWNRFIESMRHGAIALGTPEAMADFERFRTRAEQRRAAQR